MVRLLFFLSLFFLLPKLFSQEQELSFEERKQLIIDFAADEYQVPKPNYSDPEKVYWPKVIARLYKYGDKDSIANAYLTNSKFTKKLPFHFILVGMARIMAMYPHAPAMKTYKNQYLDNVCSRTDSYNPWTSEGTENHINMSRTSGYIFAELMEDYSEKEFSDSKTRKNEMKAWIRYYSKRIFEVGTGEFNASTYGIFNIIGWLNLYDFAHDGEIKTIAKAVLDYYACELALHYSWGMTSGAESRGIPQNISCRAETDYLSWLWFGNITKPVDETFFKDASYKPPLQAVHAATSAYKPNKLIVELANKDFQNPGFYKNSKPSYLLGIPAYIKHFQFINHHYSLGSAVYPYGAFAGSAYKNVTWKLISAVDFGTGKNPQMITGGGMFYNDFQGKIRNPWLQCFQYKNVLIQAHKLPENANEILAQIEDVFNTWDNDWKRDFIDRFSENDEKITNPYLNPVNVLKNYKTTREGNGVYINTFNAGVIELIEGVAFVRLEKSFLAIRSIHLATPTIKNGIIMDQAAPGKMSGLIMEVGDSEEFKNFDAFITAVLENTKITPHPQEDKINYTNVSGDVIEFMYNDNGTFTEPIYDWGYGPKEQHVIQTSPPFIQPAWPTGKGHGRIPKAKVNSEIVDLQTVWPVYSGPHFEVNKMILTVCINQKKYIVDYSENILTFKDSTN